MYGRMLFTGALHLGVMAILARELTPAQFGLVALAQVLLRIFTVVGQDGVGSFVIYDNEVGREERVEAAFWMDVTLSIIASLCGLLLVPAAVCFYGEPGLQHLLIALLLRYPIDSISQVPDAILKKRLDFQKLAIRDAVLDVLVSLGSVVLALTGWGVWSLVVPGIVASPVRAVIVLRMARWRPSARIHVRLWPRVFSFSANAIGASITGFVLNEGDTLIIGKLLGAHALGIYNLAWQSANLVGRNVTGIVGKLTLPALSVVSGNHDRLRAAAFRIFRLIAITAFPLLIGLFVVADEFILTVYGPQWEEAILPLRILILFALRHAALSPAGSVYVTVGRPDFGFKLGLITAPLYLVSIWVGSYFGIVGVAVGVTAVRTLMGLVSAKLVALCLKVELRSVIAPLLPAFSASCCMGGMVLCAKLLAPAMLPEADLSRLFALIVLGGVTYLALLRTLFNSLARELALAATPLLGSLQSVVIKALNVR